MTEQGETLVEVVERAILEATGYAGAVRRDGEKAARAAIRAVAAEILREHFEQDDPFHRGCYPHRITPDGVSVSDWLRNQTATPTGDTDGE